MIDESKIGVINILCEHKYKFWLNNKDFVLLEIIGKTEYGSIKYLVYCEMFDPIVDGTAAPYYNLNYETNSDTGIVSLISVETVRTHE